MLGSEAEGGQFACLHSLLIKVVVFTLNVRSIRLRQNIFILFPLLFFLLVLCLLLVILFIILFFNWFFFLLLNSRYFLEWFDKVVNLRFSMSQERIFDHRALVVCLVRIIV